MAELARYPREAALPRALHRVGYHRLAPGAAPEVKPEARATGGARGATLPRSPPTARRRVSTDANTSVVTVAVDVPFHFGNIRSVALDENRASDRYISPGHSGRSRRRRARTRVAALGVARAERGLPLAAAREKERLSVKTSLSLLFSSLVAIIDDDRVGSEIPHPGQRRALGLCAVSKVRARTARSAGPGPPLSIRHISPVSSEDGGAARQVPGHGASAATQIPSIPLLLSDLVSSVLSSIYIYIFIYILQSPTAALGV